MFLILLHLLTKYSHPIIKSYFVAFDILISLRFKVMSADAFSAFVEVGLNNRNALREVGRRYIVIALFWVTLGLFISESGEQPVTV